MERGISCELGRISAANSSCQLRVVWAGTMRVLGIDAGGTKTIGLLAGDDEQTIAEARGPGANLSVIGELEVEKVLHQVISDVINEHHVRLDAICLGMAGV